jgi:hypothetical protein
LLSSRFAKLSRKEQKKVDKLSAQIPYHEGRSEKEEVAKIKGRIDAIWAKAKEAYEVA